MRRKWTILGGLGALGALLGWLALRPSTPPVLPEASDLGGSAAAGLARAPAASAAEAPEGFPAPPEPPSPYIDWEDAEATMAEYRRIEALPSEEVWCGLEGLEEGTEYRVELDQVFTLWGSRGEHQGEGLWLGLRDAPGLGRLRAEGYRPVHFTWARDPADGQLHCEPDPIRMSRDLAMVEGTVRVPGVPEGGHRWVEGCEVDYDQQDADARGRFGFSALAEPCWLVGYYSDGELRWQSPAVPVRPVAGQSVEVVLEIDPWEGQLVQERDLGPLAVRSYLGGPEYDSYAREGYMGGGIPGVGGAIFHPADLIGLASGTRGEASMIVVIGNEKRRVVLAR